MGLSPRFGLRSMMLVVAAVGIWMGLATLSTALAVYVGLLLVGPVAGAIYLGRHDPDHCFAGGVVGGVLSHVAAGLLSCLLIPTPRRVALSEVGVVLVAASSVGFYAGLAVAVIVSIALKVRARLLRPATPRT